MTSPSAVQAALNEFARLGREAFLSRYGFGSSRNYLVIDPVTGMAADSKAIVGVAFGYQYPELGALRPEEFSGGDATVVPILETLGFRVVHAAASRAGEDWSREEVEAIASDHLSMLTKELTGQPYSKAAHRRRLLALLPGRTEASIEFKHCNISALLLEMGFPYLRGYKPRVNFQRRLLSEVLERLVRDHQLLEEAALAAAQRPVERHEMESFERVRIEPPRPEIRASEAEVPYAPVAVRRGYLEREARNRSLGLAGETFALEFERWRLRQLGATSLSDKVEHVSSTRGDGLGFDIRSFEADGRDRFIEVKTTTFGERTPFFVSANEARCARHHGDRFRLYRLFDFRASPRLFELAGPIEAHCILDPTTYRASFA